MLDHVLLFAFFRVPWSAEKTIKSVGNPTAVHWQECSLPNKVSARSSFFYNAVNPLNEGSSWSVYNLDWWCVQWRNCYCLKKTGAVCRWLLSPSQTSSLSPRLCLKPSMRKTWSSSTNAKSTSMGAHTFLLQWWNLFCKQYKLWCWTELMNSLFCLCLGFLEIG